MRNYTEQYASSKVPVFLGGQSMGGLVAASAVAQKNATAAGLVLFSPLMDVEKGPILMVQAALAGPLAAAMPWVRVVPAVRIEDLSEDPEVRRAVGASTVAVQTRRLLACGLQ